MALNASTLKSLMKSSIDSINVENGEVTNDQVLQALADAIINHITSDAQVLVTGGSSSGTYKVI